MKKVSIVIGVICLVSLWSFAGASDLIYSTFLGGSGPEYNDNIAIDSAGNAYIVGYTNSYDFPTTPGGYDVTHNGGFIGDICVTKLNPAGSSLVYSTLLGGSDSDLGSGIAVDTGGNAYITGNTKSADFPTTAGAFDTTHNGDSDCFIIKINNLGSGLLYSTFFGGSTADYGYGIAVDSAGNAYITGQTLSSDLPTTTGALDTTPSNMLWEDSFVCKLNATGTALGYSTFLKGSNSDYAHSIAVDNNGNAYISGATYSTDFPTTPGAFDTTYNALCDAFVSKLNPTGSALVYSTYLGGSYVEAGVLIALDTIGNAYIAGSSGSTDFPTTTGAFDTTYNGGTWDVFVSKLNNTGTALSYSTYLGGSDYDIAYGIAVDIVGNAYINGYTYSSTDFPTSPGAYDTTYNGNGDGIVSKFNPSGTLLYSTLLGGSEFDLGEGIAVDNAGNTYVTGYTYSSDFPTTVGAFDTNYNDWVDFFVTKLSTIVALGNVFYTDINLNNLVDAGDTLTMQFNKRMQVYGALASDFYLPVTGDSLGVGASVSVNPVNDTQVVIIFGSTPPTLTLPGAFSGGATTPGSPSGIDISASMAPNAIEDIYGNDAQDGGIPGVDDSGQDIQYTVSAVTAFVSAYSGATIQVSTDTVNYYYTKHNLVIPTNSILTSATITIGPPGDNHNQLSAIGLTPADVTFNSDTPATVVLEYKDADVREELGYIGNAMRIHQWSDDSGVWLPIPDSYSSQSVDTVNKTVSIKINRFDTLSGNTATFSKQLNKINTFAPNTSVVYVNIAVPIIDMTTTIVTPASFGVSNLGSFYAGGTITLSVGPKGIYTEHRLMLADYTTAGSGVSVALLQATYAERHFWPNIAVMKIVTYGDITAPAVLKMEYKDHDDSRNLFNNDVIGGSESNMRIFQWQQDIRKWVKIPEPQSVNAGSNYVTATLYGLPTSGLYAVGVDTAISPPQYANSYGSFSTSDDLTYWLFERYGDGTGPGTFTWISSFAGRNGVVQMNQNAGEKAKITQVFSVPSTGWYTASARVATDISNPAKQQKVYLYLQELSASIAIVATGNVIIQPGKGGFGGANSWRDLTISFYANSTILGVQVVGINPASSAVNGNLYIDDVWVVPGAVLPAGNVALTNASFDSDLSGWLTEIYGDGTGTGTWSWTNNQSGRSGIMSGNQTAGQKAKHTQNIDLPVAGSDALGSVWVCSGAGSMNDTQKVYLYVYSLNTSGGTNIIESANAILQPGKWTPGIWQELQFGFIPLTAYNAVQIVGINPAGKPTQNIYFDSVSVKQD